MLDKFKSRISKSSSTEEEALVRIEFPGLKLEIDDQFFETIKEFRPMLIHVKKISWFATPIAALWILLSSMGVNVQEKICQQPFLPYSPQMPEITTTEENDPRL